MFKSVSKAVSVLLAAAAIIGAATVFSGATEKASVTVTPKSGKGDRLDIRAVGPQCAEKAWPYYEAGCVKDRRQALGQAKPARIVTADRPSANVNR